MTVASSRPAYIESIRPANVVRKYEDFPVHTAQSTKYCTFSVLLFYFRPSGKVAEMLCSFLQKKKKGLLNLYQPPEQLWKRVLWLCMSLGLSRFFGRPRETPKLPKSDSGPVQLSVCIVVYPLQEPFKNQKSDSKIPRETIILVFFIGFNNYKI